MPGWATRLLKNGLPLTEKGCCCIELKRCCYIQSVLNFVESLLSIGVSLALYMWAEEAIFAIENRTPNSDEYWESVAQKELPLQKKKAKALRYVAMITAGALLITALNSIYLFFAARKESFKLLNIYLYIGILALCLDTVVRTWALRVRIGHEEVIAGTLFIRLVQMYFMYTVYSFYKRLKAAATKPEEEPAASPTELEQATPLQTPT